MSRLLLALAALLPLAGSCAEPLVPRTALPDPAGVPAGDPAALALDKTRSAAFDRFATSTACAMCHSNDDAATAMRDEAEREIAPFNLWQSTMMANAARDPLWRAVVSAEIAQTPAAQEAIEAKCMRCHAPMASEAAHARGLEPRLSDLVDDSRDLQQLASDGVSCSLCHQIERDNLGTEESFTGGFTVGEERLIYGPHEDPAPGPMQMHVDYTPTFAPHVLQANLCATCHNLTTHALEPDGTAVEGAAFPEQATYLEWLNSSYNNEVDLEGGTSCQGCHMPTTSEDGELIRTRIARSPPGGDFNIAAREPFGRHAFAGANMLMAELFKNERATLNPQAPDEAFDATRELARHRLQELTASLEVSGVSRELGSLSFDVTVRSQAGHRLPTGFPSRRAWLRVVVTSAAGRVLFSSGEYDARGRIVDQTGAILDVEKAGGPFEPHRAQIARHDEVQIYEAVMGDKSGARTGGVLRAVSHLKDNRILPLGHRADHENVAITGPKGVDDDGDFAAGTDTTRYLIDTGLDGAARVEVMLVYQTLGGRFAMDLFQNDTPEVRGFRTMIERVDTAPIVIARLALDL
ncbi:MAG: hypothetical protein IT382_10700 [Deltaproteobacteria bacterium]|nr:hypothetical protein [Deltaproteobacteria bacterium]